MRDEYKGKVIILGDWDKDKESNISALKCLPNGAVVDYTELMDYAKKLHESRSKLEDLNEEIEEKQKLIEVAKAIKTIKEYID